MRLSLVWVIYRGDNKASEDASIYCINELKRITRKQKPVIEKALNTI